MLANAPLRAFELVLVEMDGRAHRSLRTRALSLSSQAPCPSPWLYTRRRLAATCRYNPQKDGRAHELLTAAGLRLQRGRPFDAIAQYNSRVYMSARAQRRRAALEAAADARLPPGRLRAWQDDPHWDLPRAVLDDPVWEQR